MAKRILVTGAGGFVGGYLCEALAQRLTSSNIMRLTSSEDRRDGHEVVDILDRAAVDDVVARYKPDVVVHLAAQSSTASGAGNTGETFAINVSGSVNIAAAVERHCPESTVLFASSSEIYGASFLRGQATETTPPLPISAYARSKYAAEGVLDAMLAASTRLIIARPFNHSGPGQQDRFVLPSFAAQIARIESGEGARELRVGNIDIVREFMDVRDVVDAYVGLIEHADILPSRFVCNVASGAAVSLRDVIEVFRKLSRVDFEIIVDPDRVRSVDIPMAQGHPGLLRATIGWRARVPISTLLERLLDHARCHSHAAC